MQRSVQGLASLARERPRDPIEYLVSITACLQNNYFPTDCSAVPNTIWRLQLVNYVQAGYLIRHKREYETDRE